MVHGLCTITVYVDTSWHVMVDSVKSLRRNNILVLSFCDYCQFGPYILVLKSSLETIYVIYGVFRCNKLTIMCIAFRIQQTQPPNCISLQAYTTYRMRSSSPEIYRVESMIIIYIMDIYRAHGSLSIRFQVSKKIIE